jgi:peptidoglycan hydrolase-like protein with peptidoglycan-binding domain
VAFGCEASGECRRGDGPAPQPTGISLRGSVGKFGQNLATDVRQIQDGLNQISQGQGGPLPALRVDGLIGPKTIAAISKFQGAQFPGFPPDGLISPNKRTIDRLNAMLAGGGVLVTGGGSRLGVTGSVGAPQTTPDQLDLARRLALDA